MSDFQACATNGDAALPPAEPSKILKARRFIEQNYGDKISLTQVANMLEMSPSYLSERFREVTGVNFVEYVARVRYDRARELLAKEDRRISDVAFSVGFQSLSQFNRVFKRLCGQSPSTYRTAAILEKSH